jgi:hypothetical protein
MIIGIDFGHDSRCRSEKRISEGNVIRDAHNWLVEQKHWELILFISHSELLSSETMRSDPEMSQTFEEKFGKLRNHGRRSIVLIFRIPRRANRIAHDVKGVGDSDYECIPLSGRPTSFILQKRRERISQNGFPVCIEIGQINCSFSTYRAGEQHQISEGIRKQIDQLE